MQKLQPGRSRLPLERLADMRRADGELFAVVVREAHPRGTGNVPWAWVRHALAAPTRSGAPTALKRTDIRANAFLVAVASP